MQRVTSHVNLVKCDVYILYHLQCFIADREMLSVKIYMFKEYNCIRRQHGNTKQKTNKNYSIFNCFSDKLVVDNENICDPQNQTIDFGNLDDIQRNYRSFHTWLFDPIGSHNHTFNEIELSGKAHLALHRRNIDSFDQYITIGKTTGWSNLQRQYSLYLSIYLLIIFLNDFEYSLFCETGKRHSNRLHYCE